MSEFMSNVKTVNSAVRTVMVVGACSVVGYGGWFGYQNYVKPSVEAKQAMADLETLKTEFEKQDALLKKKSEQLAQTSEELKTSQELNDRLETSMKLLKVDRRMAHVTVLEMNKDEEGKPYMEVSFTEVDEDGQPVGPPKNYTLQGERLYIDGWIATFDDQYVESADELRSASLFVFKSIYGDAERPRDAQRLDVASENSPGIYKDERKRAFEEKIWSDFWRVCNDDQLQRELGIRTSNGHASYVQPKVGKTYVVKIRASGGMELDPLIEP